MSVNLLRFRTYWSRRQKVWHDYRYLHDKSKILRNTGWTWSLLWLHLSCDWALHNAVLRTQPWGFEDCSWKNWWNYKVSFTVCGIITNEWYSNFFRNQIGFLESSKSYMSWIPAIYDLERWSKDQGFLLGWVERLTTLQYNLRMEQI